MLCGGGGSGGGGVGNWQQLSPAFAIELVQLFGLFRREIENK